MHVSSIHCFSNFHIFLAPNKEVQTKKRAHLWEPMLFRNWGPRALQRCPSRRNRGPEQGVHQEAHLADGPGLPSHPVLHVQYHPKGRNPKERTLEREKRRTRGSPVSEGVRRRATNEARGTTRRGRAERDPSTKRGRLSVICRFDSFLFCTLLVFN